MSDKALEQEEALLHLHEFTYLPSVWSRFPVTQPSRKPRKSPAPISTIIIQRPKTKRQIKQAKLKQQLHNDTPVALPDFFQVTHKSSSNTTTSIKDHSFATKVKDKLNKERQTTKNELLQDGVRSLSYDIALFESKLNTQYQDVVRFQDEQSKAKGGNHQKRWRGGRKKKKKKKKKGTSDGFGVFIANVEQDLNHQ